MEGRTAAGEADRRNVIGASTVRVGNGGSTQGLSAGGASSKPTEASTQAVERETWTTTSSDMLVDVP